MLRRMFTIPNVLAGTIDNIKKLEKSTETENLINGKRWKEVKKSYSENEIIIPLELYTDDFETGNSLGSNAGTHKMTAFYMSFPTIPAHFLSSSEYILEVMLYPARLKSEEMQRCVASLIETLKDLEENGIEIGDRRVFFVMTRILGDNLALNEILGFTTSFNSTKFCRMCTLTKNDTKKNGLPTETDMRTVENYQRELELNELSKTGIREKCVFNDLKNFHCTQNFVCDIMHDLFEGIVKNDVAKILSIFIKDKKLKKINLEFINSIKQNFDYGSVEIGNLSMPLCDHHLKNNNLKMSASETKCFIFFLPLMLGSYIEEDNEYWKLLMLLVDITDIVMKSKWSETSLQMLQETIISYTTLYAHIFGPTLKPKHHNMLHYVKCIRENGPLR